MSQVAGRSEVGPGSGSESLSKVWYSMTLSGHHDFQIPVILDSEIPVILVSETSAVKQSPAGVRQAAAAAHGRRAEYRLSRSDYLPNLKGGAVAR
jgi:hypothetical protein